MMYLRVWIVGGSVAHVHSSDHKIEHNVLTVDSPDKVICAEVSGDYKDASEVIRSLSWDGSQLTGLNFVSQHVLED